MINNIHVYPYPGVGEYIYQYEYNWNTNINDIYFSTVIIRVIRESNQNGFTRG